MKVQMDHVALRVKEFDWHVNFFKEVFQMEVWRTIGEAPKRQIWFEVGIQLDEDLSEDGQRSMFDHVGLVTDCRNEILEKVKLYGCKSLPKGENWIQLPSGIVIELLERQGL